MVPLRCIIALSISSLTVGAFTLDRLAPLASFSTAQAAQQSTPSAAAPASTSSATTVAEVVRRSRDAVVQMVVLDANGKELGLGSGFLISDDGKIVTNYHVIKGAHTAIAKLANGAFFPVDGVLASDQKKDLALLKVSGRNLPHLQLADSNAVQVGDHVVAIGSPLGLEGTVSDGIISAIREDSGDTWIQTTAPASPGNSGGPLLDLNTNVVGVVSMGMTHGQNLNFAIPSATVKSVILNSHAVTPLDATTKPTASSVSASKTPSAIPPRGRIWTSLVSGHDYKVWSDGDYIYTEWVNIPVEGQGILFGRSELKKDTDGHWRGKYHTAVPVQLSTLDGLKSKLCRIEADIELTSISESRIEGITTRWDSVSFRSCEPKHLKRSSFTWIPKDTN